VCLAWPPKNWVRVVEFCHAKVGVCKVRAGLAKFRDCGLGLFRRVEETCLILGIDRVPIVVGMALYDVLYRDILSGTEWH
jgi:hypothetical protein